MDKIMPYIGFLIPVALLQLILLITALVSVLKHDHFKIGNKTIWTVIVIIIGIIGPVLYFTIGRSDE